MIDFDVEEKVDILVEEQKVKQYHLVLYNDDVNTFDFVIECLMIFCGHTPEQAEQCTFLVHYKGKCSVKVGSYEELKPICEGFLDHGLSAKIE